MDQQFRWRIEYFCESGRALGTLPVEPDWRPASDCARFEAARRGRAPLATGSARFRVEPRWDAGAGRPVLSSARVAHVQASGEELGAVEVGNEYFRALAERESAELLRRGALRAGDRFHFRVCADPLPPAPPQRAAAPQRAALCVEEEVQPIAVELAALAEPLGRARPEGASAGEFPLLIPQRLLEQIEARAAQAGALETGGVLLGRLCRDVAGAEIFAQLTVQLPARHARAERASFTFTHETWAHAHAALELRGARELLLGWWHSHPFQCRGCPPERWLRCAQNRPFFSEDDRALQAACFPKAFHIALLVSDLGLGRRATTAFGWRDGVVRARAFHRIPDARDSHQNPTSREE